MRLRDQGKLYKCPKCGKAQRRLYSYPICGARLKDTYTYCDGNLVHDELRDGIEQARERLEDKKRKLLKAEKTLKDMDNPLYRLPVDLDVVRESRTKNRDKLRRQLTAMGVDWRELGEEYGG